MAWQDGGWVGMAMGWMWRRARARRWRMGAVAVTLLGCGPATVTDADGSEDSSSGGGGSHEGSAAAASTTDTGADGSADGASSESSTGDAPAVCGNGVVEAPEACDGEPGCEDCARTCTFATPIDMNLTDISWTTSTTVPIALADGSGDLLVTSAAGLHRVAADGTEQWVQSEPTSTWRVLTMASAGVDSVWLGWITDNDGWTARFTRHAVDGGSQLESFDVGDGNESSGDASLGTGDGTLFVSSAVTTAELGKFARVQRRDAIGATVQWTRDLVDDGERDSVHTRYVTDLAVAPDGSLFLSGAVRLGVDLLDGEITALAPDGTTRWRHALDATAPYGGARRLQVLDDGGVIAIVRQQYSDFGTVGNTPGFFTQLLRLDADGNTIWQVDPTEAVEDYRVQVTSVRALGDRFVVAGAVVDDQGNAAAWLGYLDGDGALSCSSALVHPNGDPAMIDALFPTADGGLAVQGFTDDDQMGSAATARWYAPVYPF